MVIALRPVNYLKLAKQRSDFFRISLSYNCANAAVRLESDRNNTELGG